MANSKQQFMESRPANEVILMIGESLSRGDEFDVIDAPSGSIENEDGDTSLEHADHTMLNPAHATTSTNEEPPATSAGLDVLNPAQRTSSSDEEPPAAHNGQPTDVADDTDRDPDYHPDDPSSSENEDDAVPPADSLDGDPQQDNNVRKTKRHKRPAPESWKQNVCKDLRLKGNQYKTKGDKERGVRKMGLPCQSKFCKRVSTRDCQSISEDQRLSVFKAFWSMSTWDERRLFISTSVTKVEIKQKKVDGESRRQSSYAYNLKLVDGSVRRVCKPLFASTFGVSERTIVSWLNSNQDDPASATASTSRSGPKSGKCAKMTEAEKVFLLGWLKGLPTVDSHYCRNTPTYQNKKFLYPGTTIANLHLEYREAAVAAGVRAVSVTYFSDVFHQENYSVFIPRKDRCDVCESYKYSNIGEAEHQQHIKLKDEAREEKARDKESASSKKAVWTMDLQAVLLCPRTMASSLYYKTKLQVHNFTLYDLQSKAGYCYVWNESEGNLKSEVFAHLQYRHFQKVIQSNPDLEEIIIWSDGCGYQNRNANVANAYSALARENNISIVQKYLIAGHTQMECDSMHSTIERKMVNDIFTERDYVVIMQTARIRPSPYHVEQVNHRDLMRTESGYFQSIRPGKKAGDPTVHDLRGLKYDSDGQVLYKLSFSEAVEWEALPQRIHLIKERVWSPMFRATLPIKTRKYNDLQSMKSVIPADCHHFFDALPHE